LDWKPNVVLLVGGVGGAKLAYGLEKILSPEQLTVIVNTGDDFWHYGLRICPDLDTITYTLSGLVDTVNGWGLAGDTTITLDALRRLGETPWFRLGDQDLATHILRTQWWHEGCSLTEITGRLTSALGIGCAVLPMTDVPVATMIATREHGELPFQVYFVKNRWQPVIQSIRLDGIERARVTPEIVRAVRAADVILIGPSNPWLSINPILSVPGMRELLTARQIPRVAVTPIINGKAVKGPTAKIMQELSLPLTAETVVDYYGEVINGFVFDERDQNLRASLPYSASMDTLMDSDEKRLALARNLLEWIRDWKRL
jgi:LPPG:FO 2-phospho-L-lactate transferase